MTEIEKKALALVDEVILEVSSSTLVRFDPYNPTLEAVRRAIEQHEQFKREVSDAVEYFMDGPVGLGTARERLGRFILPKPVDPLVEALNEALLSEQDMGALEMADAVRAALAKRGLEVREIDG